MAINRFSKGRTFARFTPDTLEKMSILPNFYSGLYSQREQTKGLLRNLGIRPAAMDAEAANKITSDFSDKLQEDSKQFLKTGFSDPSSREMISTLVSDYQDLQKGDIFHINARGDYFRNVNEQFKKYKEDADSAGELSWIEDQQSDWMNQSMKTSLKDEEGNYLDLPTPDYTGYVDLYEKFSEMAEDVDVLSNYKITEDGIVTIEERPENAFNSMLFAFLGDRGNMEYIQKYEKLYGNSGIAETEDKTGYEFLNKDGSFDTSTLIGGIAQQVFNAKFGRSTSLTQFKGGDSSSFGPNGSFASAPLFDISESKDDETRFYNSMEVFQNGLNEQRLAYKVADEALTRSTMPAIEQVKNNSNVDISNTVKTEEYPEFLSDISSNLKLAPKDQLAAITKTLKDYGFSESDANTLKAALLSEDLQSRQLRGAVGQWGILNDEKNQKLDVLTATENASGALLRKVDEKWVPISVNTPGYFGEGEVTYNNVIDLEKHKADASSQFVQHLREAYLEGGRASVEAQMFKAEPPNEEAFEKELYKLENALNSLVWNLDYSKDSAPDINDVRLAIEEISLGLDYINLEPYSSGMGLAFGSTIGTLFQDYAGPFFRSLLETPKRMILGEEGPSQADLELGALIEGRKGANMAFRDLIYPTKYAAEAIYKNQEAAQVVGDNYYVKSALITVQDTPGGKKLNEALSGFKNAFLQQISPEMMVNLQTVNGTSYLQELEKKGIGIANINEIDISEATVQLGAHTGTDGFPVTTLVVSGSVNVAQTGAGTKKKTLPQVHFDLSELPVYNQQLDALNSLIWLTSNKAASKGSTLGTKFDQGQAQVASFYNQMVGKDVIQNNAVIQKRLTTPPENKDSYFNVELDAGEYYPNFQMPSLQVYAVPLLERNEKGKLVRVPDKYTWNVLGAGALGSAGSTSVEQLSALYGQIGKYLYDNTHGRK
jgi:hypothetical protein